MSKTTRGAFRLDFRVLVFLLLVVSVGGVALLRVGNKAVRRTRVRAAEESAEQAVGEAREVAARTALPPGWTKVMRRVTLALPLGNHEEEVTYWVNTVGMEFVSLPAGQFLMGQARVPDAEPAHWVNITRPCFMGAYEVTRAQYEAVTGKIAPTRGEPPLANHPVYLIDWEESVAFCRLLSEREGLPYRLPTEAEWEYAYRAGTMTRTYMGDRDPKELASIFYRPDAVAAGDRHAPRYHPEPVGTFPANPFGLFNMAGNAWEWCQDWYAADYYARSPTDDPPGPPAGTMHVRRGGSYDTGRGGCLSWARVPPSAAERRAGFRVVLPHDAVYNAVP